ncbi:MAG TPA: hypothetical protein VN841_14220 [Bryobacteraceae bacterium]|nr:hypothetical protein [Bryobacteraceae bacterium]
MRIRAGVVTIVLANMVLLYALYCKGDVKAAFKFLGVEFSLETKDKIAPPPRLAVPVKNPSESGR